MHEETFVFPLSFAQRRLWFLEQLFPDTPSWNLSVALRLDGPIEPKVLARSLNEIVRRHETLRTAIQLVDGEPAQEIASAAVVALSMTDLRGLPIDQQDAETRRLAAKEGQRPFDLAHRPLLRAGLLQRTQGSVLTLTLHHIVGDDWSIQILLRELSHLYQAFAHAQASPLPELPIQYADFAVWQREWLQSGVLERQLSYWRARLAGAGTLDLPTDRTRPPRPTLRGAATGLAVLPALTRRLREFSRTGNATLFMTLLAGFQVLLHRYSGQDDFCVGSPVAGRTRAETEDLIGFFVNTLVLRADLAGEPSGRQTLRRVRETVLDALANQDVPFERLVEELQPQRDISRHPLFQIMFALQNAPASAPGGNGAAVLDVPREWSNFDLALVLWETADGINGRLEYSTDLFDATTIERLGCHFLRLLEGMVDAPEEPVAALPMLTEEESCRMLRDWNATAAPFPDDRCLHELIHAQRNQRPEALAVAAGMTRLTYRDLDERANRVARNLQASGLRPGQLAAVALDRSPELIVAFLGILKAGGAYVPLDIESPPARLAAIVAETEPHVLLTRRSLLDRFAGSVRQVLCLEDEPPDVVAQEPVAQTGSHDLAYVLHTSGSSGTPKGVEISHASLLNLCAWHQRAYQVTSEDRASQVAAPSFDACGWEIWPYLTAGASVHIVDDAIRSTPAQLLTWLADEGITLSFLPTPLAEAVLQEPLPAGLRLRALLTGGDTLRRVPREHLPFRLVNHYGPTENTVVATHAAVDPGDALLPIGRPIANVEAYVLDRYRQPVPVGVPGELYLGGAGLARGYHARPDLTAERFLPHPFDPRPGARLYRTGDLVRYRADGALLFLGRLDRQVKVRGVRIECGDVEAALRQHSRVRDNVVVARPDARGDAHLVAYITCPEPTPSPGELRRFLQHKLPDTMIPAFFVPLPALPLTPHGKVDERSLPSPDGTARPSGTPYAGPRNAAEDAIALVWRDVLGIDRVGIHDDFFAHLGGHSLLATRLVSRLRSALGVELPLRSLFEAPTIAQLAPLVAAHELAASPAIGRIGRAQENLLSQLEDLSDAEVDALLGELSAREITP